METGHTTSASPHSFIPSVKLLTCALVAGAVLVTNGARDEQPPQPPAAQAFSAPVRPAPSRTEAAALPAVQQLPPSDPVWLRIPAIGVAAPMARLDLDAAGALQPPPADTPGLAGWYGDGTAPGSVGTAITTGHVDTRAGPAVFHDLGALTKGDIIEISRTDLRTAVFAVYAVEVYDKRKFPDEKVYGSSDLPELRVITCGGGYSRHTGYRGNVVIYAALTAVK
ncbi:class F sortase [Streptomyces sp. NBC_01142]|uniref:class F sortase n=1 Tax=Streptomyces sp. NBC_01142 TaxID=2975865 RepID=UPI002254A034|nr:class F sortase [Streptomyces sp. NBC_01142]MCX4821319.1 class F sortase [Streptomyces sp. NBC_01142]